MKRQRFNFAGAIAACVCLLVASSAYGQAEPGFAPLFNGRSALELVARLIQYETTQAYEIVQRSFARRAGTTDSAVFRRFLHEGFRADSAREIVRVRPKWERLAAAIAACQPAPPVSADNLELSFHADYRLRDGRFANDGWLQETPDPITKFRRWPNRNGCSTTTTSSRRWSARSASTCRGATTASCRRS